MSLKADSFEALTEDHQSGSSQLLKKTVQWVLASLDTNTVERDIRLRLAELCRAHPSMALLQAFKRFFDTIPINAARVRAWVDMYDKHESAACRHFAEYISRFRALLVHSNSGLLSGSLKLVSTPLTIFCTESRPVLEGKNLAEDLAANTKHSIYLLTDIAAFSAITRVDILAFGCDSITKRGVINKIGTAPLAAAAASQGKKSFFVGTTEKQIAWNDEILLRQGPREEVFVGSKADIRVENYYFDLTEPQYVHGIVLEQGMTKDVFNI